MSFWRLLSHLRPVQVHRVEGRHGPLFLVWEQGRLVINGPKSNQSFGSLHQVWQQALERTAPWPAQGPVLILGFGGGSAAWIIRREMRCANPIIGVDIDPVMLQLARDEFRAHRLADLELVEADALRYLARKAPTAAMVLVDLFHDLDLAPGVDEPPFFDDLHRCIAPGGHLLFNTVVHDDRSRERSQRIGIGLRQRFGPVEELDCRQGNVVFLAVRT